MPVTAGSKTSQAFWSESERALRGLGFRTFQFSIIFEIYIYTLIQYTFNFIAMAALTVLIMYSQECSPQIHHILEKVVQELKQIFKSKTNCDKCLFLRWIPEILFDLG